jgi:hypothetical protein
MELFFFFTVCNRLSLWGGNTPWPLFWKKHWIWPSRCIKLATAVASVFDSQTPQICILPCDYETKLTSHRKSASYSDFQSLRIYIRDESPDNSEKPARSLHYEIIAVFRNLSIASGTTEIHLRQWSLSSSSPDRPLDYAGSVLLRRPPFPWQNNEELPFDNLSSFISSEYCLHFIPVIFYSIFGALIPVFSHRCIGKVIS